MAGEIERNSLPNKWDIGVLSDDVVVKGRIGWRGYKKTDLRDSGPIVIGGVNIKSHLYLDLSDVKYLSREKYEESPDIQLKKGDVLLVQRGNGLGDTAYFDGSIPEATINPTLIILSEFKGEPRFLFYYLTSSQGRESVLSLASGSSIPALYQNHLKRLKYPKPPLPEQRAIATILGALDDKIELNRQMNRTLEEITKALFKSWFVDFDPVWAKMEGRDTGLPLHLADLFPARLQDSELGKVPEGWEVGRLDQVLVLQRGFDLPASQRTPGAYLVLMASGPNGTHNQYMVKGPGVTTGRSGILGKVFYVHEDYWPLNTSLWVKEFKGSTPAYAFHLLQGLNFGAFNAGSAVPTLNRNHVHNLPVLVAPMDVILAFDSLVVPLMKRQKANDEESHTLAAIRDALLPKLMSGEIRVWEAEAIAGHAL